jgi:hypothetical protein
MSQVPQTPVKVLKTIHLLRNSQASFSSPVCIATPRPLPQLATPRLAKGARIRPQAGEPNQPLQTELQQKLAIALGIAGIFGVYVTIVDYAKEQVAKSSRTSGNSYRLIVRDFEERKHIVYFYFLRFDPQLMHYSLPTR